MNNNSIDIERIRKNKENKEKSTITPRMILLIILCTIIAGGIGLILWLSLKEDGTTKAPEKEPEIRIKKKNTSKVKPISTNPDHKPNPTHTPKDIDYDTFISQILPIIIEIKLLLILYDRYF